MKVICEVEINQLSLL